MKIEIDHLSEARGKTTIQDSGPGGAHYIVISTEKPDGHGSSDKGSVAIPRVDIEEFKRALAAFT